MNGRAKTSAPPAVYRIGVIAVAIAMILLPCVYIALLLFAASGVIFFVTGTFSELWIPIGKMLPAGVSIAPKWSVGFTIAGFSFAVCMMKPFFARTITPRRSVKLDGKQEAAFFAFVQQICRAVGAPVPISIELTSDLNASASFAAGIGSLVKKRLVLTVGMPLVLALTQRELAGVIAHEFGHFRQGTAMRLTFLVRSINQWLNRAVNDRDSWDETIALMLESRRPTFLFVGVAARVGVGISRLVLRVLMWAGHTVSAFLMRAMEYDADRTELRIAGSSAFVSTMYKLASLQTVSEQIRTEMHTVWQKRLIAPENLPELIVQRDAQLSPHARLLIGSELNLARSSFLDTHPSPGDRIRQADQADARGLPLKEDPAGELLVDTAALSRLATETHFKAYLALWRADRARRARISRTG